MVFGTSRFMRRFCEEILVMALLDLMKGRFYPHSVG